MSPGISSRPSLSGIIRPIEPNGGNGVAGYKLPAFVERANYPKTRMMRRQVSPGISSRPSLSALPRGWSHGDQHDVSPGISSRPSLSGAAFPLPRRGIGRVAGYKLPAFVERSWIAACSPIRPAGVAGYKLPAFVERPKRWRWSTCFACVAGYKLPAFVERLLVCVSWRNHLTVSPGISSRPSLSA